MLPRLSPRKVFLVIIIFFFTTLLISRTNKSLWIAKNEHPHDESVNKEHVIQEGDIF